MSAATRHHADGIGLSVAVHMGYEWQKNNGSAVTERNKWSALKEDTKDGPITHQATLHDVLEKNMPR